MRFIDHTSESSGRGVEVADRRRRGQTNSSRQRAFRHVIDIHREHACVADQSHLDRLPWHGRNAGGDCSDASRSSPSYWPPEEIVEPEAIGQQGNRVSASGLIIALVSRKESGLSLRLIGISCLASKEVVKPMSAAFVGKYANTLKRLPIRINRGTNFPAHRNGFRGLVQRDVRSR